MKISSTSNECSLSELLQFLAKPHVTGCLSLEILSDYYVELEPQIYLAWFCHGYLVACQRKRHRQDIYDLAAAQQWMSTFTARKLRQRSPQNMAAGLYLESQSVLNFEQLRSIFLEEVVQRMERFCRLQTAKFQFETITELPLNSMTGLSISASNIAKQYLRKENNFPLIER